MWLSVPHFRVEILIKHHQSFSPIVMHTCFPSFISPKRRLLLQAVIGSEFKELSLPSNPLSRSHFVIFYYLQEKRTVPTIVTAHTFCASRDIRVSYGWCLVRGLKLRGENRT